MNKNEYLKNYMRERNRARIKEAKNILGNECSSCKSTIDLQFDHIDPKTKLFSLGTKQSISEHKWKEELKKCQLLCKECHKLKSIRDAGRIPLTGRHGTNACYTKNKCRCDLCKQAHSIVMKKYKGRKL